MRASRALRPFFEWPLTLRSLICAVLTILGHIVSGAPQQTHLESPCVGTTFTVPIQVGCDGTVGKDEDLFSSVSLYLKQQYINTDSFGCLSLEFVKVNLALISSFNKIK